MKVENPVVQCTLESASLFKGELPSKWERLRYSSSTDNQKQAKPRSQVNFDGNQAIHPEKFAWLCVLCCKSGVK